MIGMATKTIKEIQTPDVPFGWVCSSCGSNFCLLTRGAYCIHTNRSRHGKRPANAPPVIVEQEEAVPIDDSIVGWYGAEVILKEEVIRANATGKR